MTGNIKSVSLIIRTNDNRDKEIPLEIWQVDAIARIIGLGINLSDLDEYKVSNKEIVEERMMIYNDAIRMLHDKNNK